MTVVKGATARTAGKEAKRHSLYHLGFFLVVGNFPGHEDLRASIGRRVGNDVQMTRCSGLCDRGFQSTLCLY